jgi:hypothetical protein
MLLCEAVVVGYREKRISEMWMQEQKFRRIQMPLRLLVKLMPKVICQCKKHVPAEKSLYKRDKSTRSWCIDRIEESPRFLVRR